MTTLTRTEREELSELLPWYATGTLDAADRARVERALAADESLRAELYLVSEDRDATLDLAGEEPVPASMAARFDALLEQEAAAVRRAAARPQPSRPSLLARIAEFLAPPHRLAWAAAAAALVIVVQSGTIVSLLGERADPPGYSTASGPGAVAGVVVLVRFVPQRTAAEIEAWLTVRKGRIADGPLPGGLYRIRFAPVEGEDAAALAKRVGAENDMIALALPAQ